MNDLATTQWLVLAAAALLLGISKTGVPGAAIVAVPVFASIIPARASTGLVLPLLIVGDIVAIIHYRRDVEWRLLARLIPSTAAGILAGYFAMKAISDSQLKPAIGVIVLVMLAIKLVRKQRGPDAPAAPAGWWFPIVIGALAGATTMMANAAGPVMMVYLIAMRLPKKSFVGTGAWFFFVVNCVKVPFSAGLGLITAGSLAVNAVLAPAVLVGTLAGVFILRLIPPKLFGAAMQALAAAGAIRLLF